MPEETAGWRWRWLVAAILTLWLVWAAVFIRRTVLEVGGEHTACLVDDAMISMSYARNLVEGRGLVWDHDARRVEGFTHPLWVGLMVLANASGLPLAWRSLPVQCVSVLLLLATFVATLRLVRRHFAEGPRPWLLPAAVATLFYFPLSFWALSGMETGLQALLVVLATERTLDLRRNPDRPDRPDRASWPLAILLAAMLLLRLDMLLVVAVFLAFAFLRPSRIDAGRDRRREVHALVRTGLLAVLPCAAYQVFRLSYYGEWLPNTYYLKLSGVPLAPRLWRGALALVDFAAPLTLPLLACAVGLIVLGRRRAEYLLVAALLGCCLAYSVWVGGDAWERMDVGRMNDIGANRFIAFVMPLVFVGANGLVNLTRARRRELAPRRGRWRKVFAELGTAAAFVVLFQGCVWPGETRPRLRHLLVAGDPRIVENNRRTLARLKAAQAVLPPGATVAVVWAGIPAFFSDLRLIDALGYTDPHIARTPARRGLELANARWLRPGHVKWDYDYVIREFMPDAFLQTWPPNDASVKALLRAAGYQPTGSLWLRKTQRVALSQRAEE